eukprot:4797445-Prorocentrum_lima.AAC.1
MAKESAAAQQVVVEDIRARVAGTSIATIPESTSTESLAKVSRGLRAPPCPEAVFPFGHTHVSLSCHPLLWAEVLQRTGGRASQ